jgi:hypothetical protein
MGYLGSGKVRNQRIFDFRFQIFDLASLSSAVPRFRFYLGDAKALSSQFFFVLRYYCFGFSSFRASNLASLSSPSVRFVLRILIMPAYSPFEGGRGDVNWLRY